MAKADPQVEVPKTDELWYFDEREDVGDWWRRHGWEVTVTPSEELMASYGRQPELAARRGVPSMHLFRLRAAGGGIAQRPRYVLKSPKPRVCAIWVIAAWARTLLPAMSSGGE